MNYPTLISVAVCSYFLGSIPFGYILVRVFQGIDVRSIGSGNIGATNVARTGGKGLAIGTLALDTFKGWLPVFLVLTLSFIPVFDLAQRHILASIAALAAVLGHMFPVWLGFKGGKGVATGLGVFVALAPEAVLIAVLLFATTVAITRYVSLGSIVAAASIPFTLWWLARDVFPTPALVICAVVALLVIIRHHQNIGRLLAHTESQLGARKA